MSRRTLAQTRPVTAQRVRVGAFRVTALEDDARSTVALSRDGVLTVGTAPDVGLVVQDRTVSRYHVELSIQDGFVGFRDLGSTNGTWFGSARVKDGNAATPFRLRVGRTELLVEAQADGSEELPLRAGLGDLRGSSVAMRRVYEQIQRMAPATAPVLVLGESGTGKELVARALHRYGSRSQKPLEIVDCGNLAPTLVESLLFGHVRGAFTDAREAHDGAFVRAHGGTLFLDEIGELPLDVQPKFLRALETGEVRPLSSSRMVKVDVRIVAATHRDLRQDVNAGRFRLDLFHRLSVLQLRIPPLRERIEDLDDLIACLVDRIAKENRLVIDRPVDAATMEMFRAYDWPGNVRELANKLGQYFLLDGLDGPLQSRRPEPSGPHVPDAVFDATLAAAKETLVRAFEDEYYRRLLASTQGNVTRAAERAGVDRKTVTRAIQRLGLKKR